MENIWLKAIDLSDGIEFCDLLIELANYDDAYARPVPKDFTYQDFDIFKQSRVNLSQGINIPKYAVPTNTYWVMDKTIPIGYATLKHNASLEKPGGHFGCCLKRSVQNKGIGSIVAKLLSEIAYNDFGIEEIIYTAKDENVQSQKSLEHIGATLVSINNGYHFYKLNISKNLKEGRMK